MPVRLAAAFGREWLSTGWYLPAGVACTFRAKHFEDIEAWSVRIGAHTDDLSGCGSISRWPCISLVVPLCGLCDTSPEVVFSSPYGGLIYLESSRGNVKVEATLSNVVESPFFDLTDPTALNSW